MNYKASLDNLAKGITFILFAVLIFLGIKNIALLFSNTTTLSNIVSHLLILLLFVLIVLFSWIFAPVSYTLNDDFFMIRRRISNISIELESIIKIKLLTEKEIKGAIRTFGVGGVFGYFGTFYFSKIGSCTVYATQRKNMILIETKEKKKLIITPDEIELATELTEKIKKKIINQENKESAF